MRWRICPLMMGVRDGQCCDRAYQRPMRGGVPAEPGGMFGPGRSQFVIPAKAGIRFTESVATGGSWIPASAGMTKSLSRFYAVSEIGQRPRCLSRKTCRRIPAASLAKCLGCRFPTRRRKEALPHAMGNP